MKEPKQNQWLLIMTIFSVLLVFVTLIVFMGNKDSNIERAAESELANTPVATVAYSATVLNSCLSTAYENYQAAFSAADKNGDGKVLFVDGYTTIETSYIDAQINCYRNFGDTDKDKWVADLQAKRQQAVDTYNAWQNSLSNNQPSTNQQRPTYCTSTTYGIYDQFTQTNCY